MTAEKKKYEFMRIIALDGTTIYRSQGLTTLKDGKTNPHAFSGVLDESLDTMKLAEIYGDFESEMGYPYLAEKKYCRAIVSVSFECAIKFEQMGGAFFNYQKLYGREVVCLM